eukprot:1716290-Amphidinium_carterae.1
MQSSETQEVPGYGFQAICISLQDFPCDATTQVSSLKLQCSTSILGTAGTTDHHSEPQSLLSIMAQTDLRLSGEH